MISSKNKNRVVLPSRPEPPSVDQILEDIQSAAADDPVFSILDQKGREPVRCADSEVEVRFQQCLRYLNLNEQLEEAQRGLLRQREGLQAAGEELQKEVTRVKGQMQ
ncbi:UPF0449 protein C19orf25 homolog [Takifugu flavidus]|uniref:Uncharacterized protein n=1 Tax=Takifugu bimaculatus TaxID=433685 RepID=A0A4Z2BAM0_9TELE|nr:UPF0449 protein C19orf25 homolog [Takifugu flavidus]TNM88080.1 hypothetical protein fugu_006301 [Takifugu bimaculatus]TNM88094.1 hypothetical protein fugu_006315 [Takifugu bimaculatus]